MRGHLPHRVGVCALPATRKSASASNGRIGKGWIAIGSSDGDRWNGLRGSDEGGLRVVYSAQIVSYSLADVDCRVLDLSHDVFDPLYADRRETATVVNEIRLGPVLISDRFVASIASPHHKMWLALPLGLIRG